MAIDALVLMVLLKAINEDDVGFGTAFLVALVTSIGTTLLSIGLAALMGIAGIVVVGAVRR
jgi:hypothetical protein